MSNNTEPSVSFSQILACTMTEPSTLGRRVRDLRHRKGWTLDQLAKEAEVSKGFVSAVENDRNQPSGRIVLRLARALGASVDYLMQGAESASGPVRTTTIQIPEELATLAAERDWSFSKVTAMLEARSAIFARRRDAPPRPFTRKDWSDFADTLAPYLEQDPD